MKKILFLMLASLPLLANAQTGNYDVKGKVGKLEPPAKAYLLRRVNGQNSVDSVALIDGIFEFKGSLAEPTQALLLLDHSGIGINNLGPGADVLTMYLENGSILINGTDSVKKAKITGSKLNEDNAKLAAAIKPVMDKAVILNNEYQKATEADRPKLADKFKELQAEQKSILKKYIQQNPSSFVSMDALRSFGGPSPDYNEVIPLFSSLSPAVQTSENGKNYKVVLDQLKSTSIGSVAPNFTQNDPSGKPVSLSSFKGKYVLIDFWASWCGPCRQENPNVVKVYNQYKNKNFTVLGVSLDRPNGKDAWLQAIKADGLTWNHVSDLKFWDNEVAALYGVHSIPGNFLVDPSGKIIAKDLRGDDLEQTLAKLLK
ncbi:TlpA disulfide reductase family protein [Mucilaginibacter arboris]|uniref:Redoxin domain-containing protein n=1 Tax=Mucilaginibacter arboris TaxID=2682090 RepID=A0A7K1SV20_9SPHI|nr:TlpA disulfide reductase family protein [Mucilaginibacter arboris]MVN21181.1 redoxin domain-containing protein [Mucilaginibacter arboris]